MIVSPWGYRVKLTRKVAWLIIRIEARKAKYRFLAILYGFLVTLLKFRIRVFK